MSTYNVDNEASFLVIAADLEKSLHGFDRAQARAIRALLPAIVQHTKAEQLTHWHNNMLFENSAKATSRTIGIMTFLLAAALSRGDRRKVGPFLEIILRDIAESAAEQLRDSQPVQRMPVGPSSPIVPPATN